MTDKELRKLNKTELLWIIRDQEAEILELKQKLESSKGENSAEEIEEAVNSKAEGETDDKS